MSLVINLSRSAIALSLVLGACGDNDNTECGTGTMLVDGECVAGTIECGAGTTLTNGECVSDVVCGTGTMNMAGMCVPTTTPPVTTYRQVEHLGRPGIAEALLLSNGFLDAYNATAPFYVGVDPGALGMVVGEAKTVLRALFYGTCLLNGIAGFSDPAVGAKPGGVQCAATGTGIFSDGATNGAASVVLATATTDAATVYANRVFDQFVPDVLRIDTGADSAYLTLCGAAATGEPLLCGGRTLRDDVIDTTYFYLLAGAAVPTGATTPGPVQNQVIALVTDGVYFSTTTNVGTLGTPNAANPNQFKPAVSATFPYSAPPL